MLSAQDISQMRGAAPVVTCSRAPLVRSRDAERHDAVGVQLGPSEGPVVGRDVLVTSTTDRIQLPAIRMRRRGWQPVTAAAAGLAAIDPRPERLGVAAARSISAGHSGAMAGRVLAAAVAVHGRDAGRTGRAREAHLCRASAIEMAFGEDALRHDMTLAAWNAARTRGPLDVGLVSAHPRRVRSAVALEIRGRRGIQPPVTGRAAFDARRVHPAIHVQRAIGDGVLVGANGCAVAERALADLWVRRRRRISVARGAAQRPALDPARGGRRRARARPVTKGV